MGFVKRSKFDHQTKNTKARAKNFVVFGKLIKKKNYLNKKAPSPKNAVASTLLRLKKSKKS